MIKHLLIGQGKGGNRHNCQNNNSKNPPLAPKVKGRTNEVENYICDVRVQNQTDMFANTTKEITYYTGCHCKDPCDICNTIKQLTDVTVPPPLVQKLGSPQVNNLILQKEVDLFMKSELAHATRKATIYSVVYG